MRIITTAIRRALILALIGAAASGIWVWLRDRKSPPVPPTPPRPEQEAPPENPATSEPRSNEMSPWVLPNDDGSAPDTHPIKANDNSQIFHVPGGSSYARTKPARCYATAEAAEADGYRQAKS